MLSSIGVSQITSLSHLAHFNTNSPAVVIPHVNIQYPLTNSSNASNIQNKSIKDIWSLCEDKAFDWNIIDQLAASHGGFTICPPMPQMLPQTVGNSELAEERKDKNWLTKNRPHISENQVFDELSKAMRDENGTLFQSFHTRSYLHCVTEMLETTNSIGHGLSAEWQGVAKLKGCNLPTLLASKNCQKVFKTLPKILRKCCGNLQVFRADVDATSRRLKGVYLNTVGELLIDFVQPASFSTGYSTITRSNIMNAYQLAHLKTKDKEVDFIAVFPKLRCIVQIEVKATVAKHTFIKYKQQADEQIRMLKEWFTSAHCDIFHSWNYLGVIVFPLLRKRALPASAIRPCDHDFLLFLDDLETGLEKWWWQTRERLSQLRPMSTRDGREAYVEFMKRVLLLSRFESDMRLSLAECSQKVQISLHGDDAKAVVPGARVQDSWPSYQSACEMILSAVDCVRLKDFNDTEKPVLSSTLWSKDKFKLLQSDPQKMILASDYGTGKTLLMKAKARDMALNPTKKVYYISLCSIDYYTLPCHAVYGKPAIFDISTKVELSGTNVTFLDALDLKNLYEKEVDGPENNGYNLLQWFVAKDPDADYFIDEYGWIENDLSEKSESYLTQLTDTAMKRLWVALRVVNHSVRTYTNRLQNLLTNLQSEKAFVICDLPIVIRCPGELTRTANRLASSLVYERVWVSSLPYGKALDTTPGFPPRAMQTTATATHLQEVVEKIITFTKSKNFLILLLTKQYGGTNRLYEALKALNHSFLTYMVDEDDGDVKDLKAYIDSPNTILITNMRSFSGMEANVVVCIEGSVTNGGSFENLVYYGKKLFNHSIEMPGKIISVGKEVGKDRMSFSKCWEVLTGGKARSPDERSSGALDFLRIGKIGHRRDGCLRSSSMLIHVVVDEPERYRYLCNNGYQGLGSFRPVHMRYLDALFLKVWYPTVGLFMCFSNYVSLRCTLRLTGFFFSCAIWIAGLMNTFFGVDSSWCSYDVWSATFYISLFSAYLCFSVLWFYFFDNVNIFLIYGVFFEWASLAW